MDLVIHLPDEFVDLTVTGCDDSTCDAIHRANVVMFASSLMLAFNRLQMDYEVDQASWPDEATTDLEVAINRNAIADTMITVHAVTEALIAQAPDAFDALSDELVRRHPELARGAS